MWLLAGTTGSRGRFFSFIVMLAASAAATASSLGFAFSYETIIAVAIMAALSLTIVLGQAIAAHMCRIKYSIVKFTLLVALWEIVIVGICIMVIGVAEAIAIGSRMGIFQAIAVLAGVALAAGIMGAVVYCMNLPFLILVQRNQFWKQRFVNWTRVEQPHIVFYEQVPKNPFIE